MDLFVQISLTFHKPCIHRLIVKFVQLWQDSNENYIIADKLIVNYGYNHFLEKIIKIYNIKNKANKFLAGLFSYIIFWLHHDKKLDKTFEGSFILIFL